MESEKFHGLDHLRASAIVLVLLYHYRMFEHPAWIDSIGWIGWTGVDLFFVLSGFLISNQLFREIREHKTIRPKIFFIKRFFRIIPPYAFTLLLYFSVPAFREREALPPWWKFITFTQNYGLDVISQGTFSHAWSLCIEEQFYFALPLLLLTLIRLKSIKSIKFGIVFLLVTIILLRAFLWNHYIIPNINSEDFWKEWYMNIYYPTYTRLDGLSMGVLIGYLFQFSAKFKGFVERNGNRLLLTGILAVAFSLWFCRDQYSASASIFGFTLVAVSYGIMVAGAISKSSFLSRKPCFITSQLAVLSYSVYLSHKGIIHLVQLFLDENNIPVSGNTTVIICFLACLAIGFFYRYSIEKASLMIRDKVLQINYSNIK